MRRATRVRTGRAQRLGTVGAARTLGLRGTGAKSARLLDSEHDGRTWLKGARVGFDALDMPNSHCSRASFVGCSHAPRVSLVCAVALGAVSCAASRRAPEWLSQASAAPASFVSRAPEDAPPAYFAKRGFYLGALAAATTLSDSDFDGQGGLIDPVNNNQFILAQLDPGIGWGAAVGYRGRENSVQFSYTTTEHDDEFGSSSLESSISTYSLDFKHHWNVDSALQPFLLIGVSVPRIRITDGVSNGGSVDDAVYQGLGANLGGGAALYLTPAIALFGEGYYRWASIEDVRGLGTRRDIDHRLDGSGLGLRAGISFTF